MSLHVRRLASRFLRESPVGPAAPCRVGRVFAQALVVGVTVWAVCGVFAFCTAGLLAHSCEHDESGARGHEAMCGEDPCISNYLRPGIPTAPAPAIAALAHVPRVPAAPCPLATPPAQGTSPAPRSSDAAPLRL